MDISLEHWIGFNVAIFILLFADLWHSYKNPHAVRLKEALFYSAGWITLALLFNGWIYLSFGPQHGLDFFTGYLVEKSLSVDNLFIFLVLFSHFQVPDQAKHLVLFYGLLGAIVMRALLIWAGVALVNSFGWIFIFFGLFLILTGIKLAFKNEESLKVEENAIYRWLKRCFPFTDSYHGTRFFVTLSGVRKATPLVAVLVLIETTDLIFALDSVPAILGITTEPFIVYTSNIFAILGLRSLFFALEGVMKAFHFLHYALAFILVFIGFKMIVGHYLEIPTWFTLSVLILSLSTAIIASLLYPKAT